MKLNLLLTSPSAAVQHILLSRIFRFGQKFSVVLYDAICIRADKETKRRHVVSVGDEGPTIRKLFPRRDGTAICLTTVFQIETAPRDKEQIETH